MWETGGMAIYRVLPELERAMMEDFTRALGARIRALREAQGLAQAEMARQAHLSREMLRLMEVGERAVSVDRLPRLAALLGLTVTELLAPVEPAQLPPLEPLPTPAEAARMESDSEPS